MATNVSYDDGLIVFVVLGIVWLAVSHEFAVSVELAWAIAGISRSNAMKIEERNSENEI